MITSSLPLCPRCHGMLGGPAVAVKPVFDFTGVEFNGPTAKMVVKCNNCSGELNISVEMTEEVGDPKTKKMDGLI